MNIQIKKKRANTRQILTYKQSNIDALSDILSHAPWGPIEIFNDVDDAVDYFVTNRPQDKPWFTNVILRIFRNRDQAITK